ncbi:MAG: PocR ligand-binding domain-containing protein [Clostridia bacterium]|nr:PocR ligand-binding domain-containing protein [Clostridia bacterium]
MKSSFDIEKINIFLKNFYKAVGIRISVFDNEFKLVTEYPLTPPKYCSLIRSTNRGLNGCITCDINALKTAKKENKTYIYTCHAGLTEAVSPIKFKGIVMGYVILAHMFPKENHTKHLNNALKKSASYGISSAQALPALKEIQPQTTEHIDACAQLLDAVATYLHTTNWVKWKSEDLTLKITQYIEQNLDKKLTSELLCKIFFISRTKLYQISMDSYGQGISKYILFKKIEKAKQLLNSNHTVAQTANETGFADPNYFSKVFKKEVGVLASIYKKTDS